MKTLLLFLSLICCISVNSVLAQNKAQQRITGKVTDAVTGEAFPGVNIIIEGTGIGTSTGSDGTYSIMVDGPGTVLLFSFIGSMPEKVTVGNLRTIDVSLKTDIMALQEVVITAQTKGQKQALQQQIHSNTIKNVVAPDRLQENPDANATEAIGRLPGISVLRSGGEGSGLVIRGLEPKYTNVTLNGLQSNVNLNGVSQYALQGVEVFKSLTADMEANSVAGTVNLKLREAPKNFHLNVMTQGGYNQLNNYWGNYKLLGEVSNRFFNDKLGILVTANAERVNRSIQTMSAAYGIDGSNPEGDILLGAISLNDIYSVIYRRSALLSMDYKLTPGTTLMFYGMYNNSRSDYQSQSKNYGLGGAGSVGYSFSANNPDDKGETVQTSLSGETKLKFLNIKADYGISYSMGKSIATNNKSWNFIFNSASTSAITDIAHRKLDPTAIVPLFTDNPDNFLDCWLTGMGVANSKGQDKNINTYLNFTIPFKVGGLITGNIKFGGLYRNKSRLVDNLAGSMGANANYNVYAPKVLADSLDWVVRNASDNVSAVNLSGKKIENFLNGDYNFGYAFNMDRLNQIADTWTSVSDYYFAKGPEVYLPIFGDINKLGYAQNVPACMLNDQNIKETYSAGFIMPEINFGEYVMLLPGVRIEATDAALKGFYALPPTYVPNIVAPLSGHDTSAVRKDNFLLPMVHLRIKPLKSFYMHFAYTQTLSRPDFNSLSPNYYVNTGWAPFSYTASNPALRSELWTNYDAQFTLHSSKVGLLSVTGFYKTVQDKIWSRTYKRIKGDPKIEPFPDNAVVNVTIVENHPYTVYVKGIECEWQTSFYYLPKPFNFFTLNANYTYAQSETTYPYTIVKNVTPPGGGRPVATRIDSTITGPMLYQPKHIANISLGFNYKGFNVWLSYQYNGLIYTGINYMGAPRLDSQKDYFNRWDLQLTQKFAIKKLKGFELVANIANISDFTESQRLTGDIRPTYQENYGMTIDLGLRFRF